jgi:UTP-glucose-1-phosphate uridylyltransferase
MIDLINSKHHHEHTQDLEDPPESLYEVINGSYPNIDSKASLVMESSVHAQSKRKSCPVTKLSFEEPALSEPPENLQISGRKYVLDESLKFVQSRHESKTAYEAQLNLTGDASQGKVSEKTKEMVDFVD